MRLTLLNQFYLPDISPTAQLAGSLAEHRAALGDEVTVIAGSALYTPHADASRPAAGKVRVARVPTPGFGKKVTLIRALDYLCFFLLAAVRVVCLPRQQVVVAMTTPPYIALVALLHKFIHRRTKLVLWVMDCYPEVPEMAGMLKSRSLASRILRRVNRFLFRHLDHVICLDGAMQQVVGRSAAGPGRPPFTVIPNWERAGQFPPGGSYPAWRGVAEHGLAGRFVVLYLGNAGVGHEFDTVLAAAEQLKGEPITFLFVGGGSRWKELERAKAEKGLDNIRLMGYVPKEETGTLMAACGAALITLRDPAAGLISPSKLHSNLALGLPVLYIGPTGSNVDEAVGRHGVGVSLRAGDVAGVVGFVKRLAADPHHHAELRTAARAAFDAEYCDARTLPRFDAILDAFARSPSSETRS